MKKVLIINESAVMKEAEFENKIPYEFMRNTVDGYIEIVPRTINGVECCVCVNEEGRIRNMPTTLVAKSTKGNIIEDFRGNVIIMKFDGVDDNIGFEKSDIDKIQNALKPKTYRNIYGTLKAIETNKMTY